MRVQRFEGLFKTNQVFKSTSTEYNRKFYDMDSVDDALKTDSLDGPILPQVARKFKAAFNILFPAKVLKEAQHIKNQIDECVDGPEFQAVA